jgi:ABC-type oligopeptide transport system substrate-binding subunit
VPTLLGWTQDYPDPPNRLSIYWTCDSTIYAAIAGYCNEDFDALIRQADQELDPAKRMALYEEARQIPVDDVPAVFAFNLAMVVLMKLEATGYQATASDAFDPGSWASLMTMGLSGWNAGPVARSAPLRRTR